MATIVLLIVALYLQYSATTTILLSSDRDQRSRSLWLSVCLCLSSLSARWLRAECNRLLRTIKINTTSQDLDSTCKRSRHISGLWRANTNDTSGSSEASNKWILCSRNSLHRPCVGRYPFANRFVDGRQYEERRSSSSSLSST